MSQAPEARPSPPSVYHERQRLELCAVHALNNVLQEQLFSQEAADEICKSFILRCTPGPGRCVVGQEEVDGIYYNLDSKLRAPEALGDEDGVRTFLAAALAQGLCEVLLVVTKEVEEAGCWLNTS